MASIEDLSLPAPTGAPADFRPLVRLYRAAIAPGCADMAAALEALFRRNGWLPDWRDVVWRFDHYHSNAHETLGVISGRAEIQLGGAAGPVVAVTAGDVIMLPAGASHRCCDQTPDFLVVGAYPPGQKDFATCTDVFSEETLAQIDAVPPPPADPVLG